MTIFEFVSEHKWTITQWVVIALHLVFAIIQMTNGYVTEDALEKRMYVTTAELDTRVEALENSIALLNEPPLDEIEDELAESTLG
jgi:hypothetical protein